MCIAWPKQIKDAGGIREQFHHVIDIVPTILEATGVKAPEMVDGIAQRPIEGVSMAYSFDKANAKVPSRHRTQYFEMFGHRGIYHDGWYANTRPISAPWNLTQTPNPDVMNGYPWELYDLNKDWTQNDDLAAKQPDKLKELQDLFIVEATKYQVFPLDNSMATRMISPRPSATAGRNVFTYSGELTGIPMGAAPMLLDSSYTITAEIEVPADGAEGVIATQGGRFGGWGFYLLKGEAGFLMEHARPAPHPLGRASSARPGQAHARIRLQIRRAGHGDPGVQQSQRARPRRPGDAQGRRQCRLDT